MGGNEVIQEFGVTQVFFNYLQFYNVSIDTTVIPLACNFAKCDWCKMLNSYANFIQQFCKLFI